MAKTKRERAAYNREWRARNKAHLKAYEAERNKQIPSERREQKRRWYLKHREERRVYNKAYHARTREQRHAYDKARYDERHAYRLAYFRKLKRDVLAAYGGKCACCKETTLEFLSIDHINGDGATHRKVEKCGGGSPFYLWLKRHKYPKDNFQALCFNCNFAKHRYGQCPHQRVIGGEVGG